MHLHAEWYTSKLNKIISLLQLKIDNTGVNWPHCGTHKIILQDLLASILQQEAWVTARQRSKPYVLKLCEEREEAVVSNRFQIGNDKARCVNLQAMICKWAISYTLIPGSVLQGIEPRAVILGSQFSILDWDDLAPPSISP